MKSYSNQRSNSEIFTILLFLFWQYSIIIATGTGNAVYPISLQFLDQSYDLSEYFWWAKVSSLSTVPSSFLEVQTFTNNP